MLGHAPLEAVYIYFDTVSFDQIERDQKVVMGEFLPLPLLVHQTQKWLYAVKTAEVRPIQ